MPFAGHLNPSLPIIKELTSKGVEIRFYCFRDEAIETKIELFGATFYELPTKQENPNKLIEPDFPTMCAFLAETTLEVVPYLLPRLKDDPPASIVFDSFCFWGYVLSKCLSVPSVCLIPTFALHQSFFPKLAIPFIVISGGIRKAFPGVKALKQFNRMLKLINEKYAYIGSNILDVIMLPSNLKIVFTSRIFQIKNQVFDDSYLFVGASLIEMEENLDFRKELNNKLRTNNSSIIYVSMGTVINKKPAFFQQFIKAFKNTAFTVIVSIGNGMSVGDLGPIPDNFIIKNIVPQMEVLKRASVFISHCGMNSTTEALISRVPMLMYPQVGDRVVIARRLVKFKAAILLKKGKLSPEYLRKSVNVLLHNAELRSNIEQLAISLESSGGHSKAASAILALSV